VLFFATNQMPCHDPERGHGGTVTSKKRPRQGYDEEDMDIGNKKVD
jgi:hypothetical protein